MAEHRMSTRSRRTFYELVTLPDGAVPLAETALLLARQGAHVVVADADAQGAEKVAAEAAQLTSAEFVVHTAVDLSNSGSLSQAAEFAILQFGGIDIVIKTAAIFPVPENAGELTEAQWYAP